MKVLVLNGSPKRDKSDTMHVTRAFLEGMAEAGAQEVRVVHVIDKRIEYCDGCFACMRNGGRCRHDDDMRGILEEILASDALVFSFPLYGFGMPAPLKALLDRTLPLGRMTMRKAGDRYEHVAQTDFSHLRYVMICGCGFPNARHNFEAVVAQFGLMFPRNRTVLTIPENPMFNAPEATPVTVPRLALVRQAGRAFAETGAVPEEMLVAIGSPMIPEEEYARIVNAGPGGG
jgi:putative NADPH-quinone reductase